MDTTGCQPFPREGRRKSTTYFELTSMNTLFDRPKNAESKTGSCVAVVERRIKTAGVPLGLLTLLLTAPLSGYANEAPVALDRSKTLREDKTARIVLKASDADKDKLTYSISQNPQHGTVSLNGKVAKYTPQANYNGSDSFQYLANDGTTDSAAATVSLTVKAVNDRPVATAASQNVLMGAAYSFDLHGSDVEGDPLTFRIVRKPKKGKIVLDGDTVTYTPKKADYQGADFFTFRVRDGKKVSKVARIDLNVTDTVDEVAQVKLNDTGVVTCANATDNGLDCPQAGFPGQDAEYGADVLSNSNTDGYAGFSFTKLGGNGQALATQNAAWDAAGSEAAGSQWACVRDEVTGLVWENKTESGLHDKDNTYTWYQTDTGNNAGFAGKADGGACDGSTCDTQAYVQAVNAQALCGFEDWRMPNVEELAGLAALDGKKPAIDGGFFANSVGGMYWSNNPYAPSGDYAWSVDFGQGYVAAGAKLFPGRVRLVRGAH